MISDASPSGSYIFANLLRIIRFVSQALSDGKIALMASLSLPNWRLSRVVPSFHAMPNSFTFECHLCNSNVSWANISSHADLPLCTFPRSRGPPLIRSCTYSIFSILSVSSLPYSFPGDVVWLPRGEVVCMEYKRARHLQSSALCVVPMQMKKRRLLRSDWFWQSNGWGDSFASNWFVVGFLAPNKPTNSFVFLLSLE